MLTVTLLLFTLVAVEINKIKRTIFWLYNKYPADMTIRNVYIENWNQVANFEN